MSEFGEKIPLPPVIHVPEPVEEVPFNITVELLAQTVGLDPEVTVPGEVTKTETVPESPGQPATVANTEYTPEATSEALGIDGF